MKNVFMAVAMDLGNASSPWGSIHPNDKQDVGKRLALAARGVSYEEHVYYTGPLVAGVKIASRLRGNQAEIDVIYSSVGEGGVEIRTRKGFEVRHLKFLAYSKTGTCLAPAGLLFWPVVTD